MDAADLVVINTCAIREAAEAKVIGRQGELAKLKAANASLRVVMTGCAVREMDRERPRPPFPGGRPVPAARTRSRSSSTGWGSRRRRGRSGSAWRWAASARRRSSGEPSSASRTTCPARARRRSPAAPSIAASAVSAWLPIIYGCDKTCTYCIVPFSRGPGAQPSVRRDRRRGARDRRRRLPRGHAARPERQLVRARPRAGGAIRPRPHRALGRSPARSRSAAGPRGAHPRDRRAADRRRQPGDPAPALHHLAPVGPLGPAHRRRWRECPSVCEAPPPARAVRATTRCSGGWAASTRSSTTCERLARIRDAVPDIAISTDVIVGFCGETEAQFESDAPAARDGSATTRCSRPRTRSGRARPRRRSRRRPGGRQAPAPERAARAPGADRAGAQSGLARPEVEVLVDTIVPPRTHDHADGAGEDRRPRRWTRGGRAASRAAVASPAGRARTSSSTSRAARSGRALVNVRIEHAGPYALRGTAVA